MKILFAFIADSVKDLGYESYDIKGLCSTIFVKGDFPTEKYRVVLHLCYRIEDEASLQEINLSIRWVDEQTRKSLTVPYPFTLPEPFLFQQPKSHLAIPLQLPFPSAGRYRFDILLDGEKVKEAPFEVRQYPKATMLS